MCATNISADVRTLPKSTGSVKNSCQPPMCVVNKNGLIVLKNDKSRVDRIIKTIMIAMVIMIGPKELSTKEENINASVATVVMLSSE